MTSPSVTVLCCEGFHDRAFLSGWIEHIGWIDPGKGQEGRGRISVPDPWQPSQSIKGGHYLFRSPSPPESSILIVPCHGDSQVLREARLRLEGRATKPVSRVIINLDTDTEPGADTDAAITAVNESIRSIVLKLDPVATQDPSGDFNVGGSSGTTKVSTLLWWTDDPSATGVPDQQTLARIIH